METATPEPEVFDSQQVAALAAGKQDKAWYFIETFYHEQGEEGSGYVNEKFLRGIARQVPGLNVAEWFSDRNSRDLGKQIETDKQTVNGVGFTGTPSFLVGKTNGAMRKLEYASVEQPAQFEEAIKAARFE
jgi:protein-disulfide isomerase